MNIEHTSWNFCQMEGTWILRGTFVVSNLSCSTDGSVVDKPIEADFFSDFGWSWFGDKLADKLKRTSRSTRPSSVTKAVVPYHGTDGNQDTSSVPHDRRIGSLKRSFWYHHLMVTNWPVSNKQACARVLCWATCIALHARAHRMNYEHQLWWCVPAPACYGEIGRREIDRVLFHLQRYTLHVHLLVLASDDNILRVVLGILYQANV
jgi:hypothetical protein